MGCVPDSLSYLFRVSAQNVRVSGVVTDALGPIPGVNIMEEGTTNGTVTDVNGKYSISVSAKSTLVFLV